MAGSTVRPELRRRGILRCLIALVGAVCLGLTLLATPPRAAADEEPATPPRSGMDDFGACLVGRGSGSLLLLLDQSGSLRETDPEGTRVQAASYLAERLADFSERSGAVVDVRVAGFSDSYAPVGEWTGISPDNVAAVKQSVEAIGSDIRDYDTDYWTALEGARQDLVDHDESGCRAIAWFSDGAFDLDVRDTRAVRDAIGSEKPYAPGVSLDEESGVARAEAAGVADICRDTGLADQLRGSGVVLLGIGLEAGDTDLTLMRRVTLAGGDNAASAGLEACGALSSPQGAFYTAGGIDQLLLAFDAIGTPGDTVRSSSVEICQGQVCADGELSFVLDKSVDTVHVLATTDVDDLDAYLYPPGASAPMILSAQAGDAQPADGISYQWRTRRTLEIDLDAATSKAWDGQWRIAFVDTRAQSEDKQVHVNLHLTSPLTLSWKDLDTTTLRQGESVEATIVLLSRVDGDVVRADKFTGAVSYSVTLTDAAGEEHTLLDSDDLGDIEHPVELAIGEDVAVGTGAVTTSVAVTTADATDGGKTIPGTQLDPTTSSVPVTVNPPSNFPELGATIDFGRLEKETTATAELDVTGPGCVWVGADSLKLTGAPHGAGDISVSAAASTPEQCVSAADGAKASLPLTLTVGSQANGAVTGTVKVSVAPLDEPERVQVVEVPMTAEMRRPLNVATTWSTFAIALAAGIGIPLALLYLFKSLSARIPAGTLIAGTKVVEVPQAGSAASIDFGPEELTMHSLTRRQRDCAVAGFHLRTVVGISPTEAPYVVVAGPDAPSVSGAVGGARDGHAVLPLAVRGNWVAILDQPDSPRRVTLLVLLASAAPEAIEKVVADAREHLATAVASVASSSRPAVAQDAGAGLGADAGAADPGLDGANPFGDSAPLGGSAPAEDSSPFG
ncbi:VWA domain-containing protein [Actinomyces sp. 565]|uniref:VWA domain-containing protein n=1 Tax=Actinomyces sp. 565 TaxID=2057794 RepID=UPI0013A69F8E|nr:VWA domain-containing protein [Actinomyces sp. 565]NDR53412.1 VWA domain-containing protein [Actinomyces sp. 565]